MIRTFAVCGLWILVLPAAAAQIDRFRDADGRAVAVRVAGAGLVHTAQLMPNVAEAPDAEQGRQVLRQLAEVLAHCGAARGDVVKLNVYVRDAAMRELFSTQLEDWFGDQPPAVSFVASPLPQSTAAIGLDAVVAIDANKASGIDAGNGELAVLPLGDVIYVSGQAESGDLRQATRETMAGLLKTIGHLGLADRDIIQVKCFIKPIREVAVANAEIANALGEARPPVVHVEWASTSRAIEIELIVAAEHQDSPDTISYITPPWMKSSPVFSRVARIHGDERIYIAGLYPEKTGDGAAQVKSIFEQLRSATEASGSSMRHLAKATYYVSDEDASAQLNQLRPSYYDPNRPPAASKAAVKSVAAENVGITIDMIAVGQPRF